MLLLGESRVHVFPITSHGKCKIMIMNQVFFFAIMKNSRTQVKVGVNEKVTGN